MNTFSDDSTKNIPKIVLWFNKVENSLLVSCLVIMIVLAFVNIVLRNTVGGGVVWADRLLINLVLWVALLGGEIASKKRGDHIRIDVISHLLPIDYHKYLNVITDLFAAVVCGLLSYQAAVLLVTIEYPEHKAFIPYLESWVPMVIMPIGFGVMGFRFIRYMILDIISIFRQK